MQSLTSISRRQRAFRIPLQPCFGRRQARITGRLRLRKDRRSERQLAPEEVR
jgi:hypothetical protein